MTPPRLRSPSFCRYDAWSAMGKPRPTCQPPPRERSPWPASEKLLPCDYDASPAKAKPPANRREREFEPAPEARLPER